MNTAAAALPGTIVWDANHPVARSTIRREAAAALLAHLRRLIAL
jgi:hypothetical protein